MGRGRGRGRKVTNGSRTHEDKNSSGEEVVVAPARKRRGRPQKHKINQAAVVKKSLVDVDDGDEDYHQVGGAAGDGANKLKASTAENVPAGAGGTNNKRNRVPKEEEEEEDSINLDMEENSSSTRSSNDESTRSNGFRQVGSRRKSTPRRAAEAGL